jgi:DNA-directed RNA polymerase subunit RPC12/RpoP
MRAKNFQVCPACHKRITHPPLGGTICANCLKRFHTRCMVRVRKKDKKARYWLCPDCYGKQQEDLVVTKSVSMRSRRQREQKARLLPADTPAKEHAESRF